MTAPNRRCSIALAGTLAGALAITAPALAQSDWERDEIPERLDEALRGLLDRVKPTLEDMFDVLGVLDQIDSPTNYQKPEILPNGDILIRRTPDAPEWRPDADDEPDNEPEPGSPLERELDRGEPTRI